MSAGSAEATDADGTGRGGTERSIEVEWEELARATTHPLQIAVLEILGLDGGRILSPADLQHELQIPLSNANYHVTTLAEKGLLVMVDRKPVRGATEHFYTLPRPSGPMDEWLRQRQSELLEDPLRVEMIGLLGDAADDGLGRAELERRLSGEPSPTDVLIHLARLEAAELVRREDRIYRVI